MLISWEIMSQEKYDLPMKLGKLDKTKVYGALTKLWAKEKCAVLCWWMFWDGTWKGVDSKGK